MIEIESENTDVCLLAAGGDQDGHRFGGGRRRTAEAAPCRVGTGSAIRGWLAQSEALRFSNMHHVTGTLLTPIMPPLRRHFHPGPRNSLIPHGRQLPWFRPVPSQTAELRTAPARDPEIQQLINPEIEKYLK
ncbi:MAG: hypothetical protein ACLQOO_07680 [Terriglobia bacterium]